MAKDMTHRYVIGLGSNLDDRLGLLGAAHQAIEAGIGRIDATAPIYETPPMGAADQPFLNTAVLLTSPLSPPAMLKALLVIEADLGRVRRERWGNRRIDCDILMWETSGIATTFEDGDLTVPHPALLERDFALVPAAAVAGDWRHPMTGKTLKAELEARGYALTTLN
jgi:2-amino-4-hydroxy-6-hydroxymethyldihydropteridine diphosphokinase